MERNGESRELPGIPGIPFRHGLGNSIEMLAAALRLLRTPGKPATLAGLSGIAFRVLWRDADPASEAVWDPAVAGVAAFDPLSVASASRGWRLLWYRGTAPGLAWQFAVQAIARGQPALSYGFAGEPEDALIVGLEHGEEGRRLLVLTRHSPTPLSFDAEADPWPGADARGTCIGLFDPLPPRAAPEPEMLFRRAARRAVWVSGTGADRLSAHFVPGTRAYGRWIASLEAPELIDAAPPGSGRWIEAYGLSAPSSAAERGGLLVRHVQHRALSALVDARAWACAFLLESAGEVETGEAASCFEREKTALAEASHLWPPVIEGPWEAFRLADPPLGFHERTWREETVRCLRLARAAYDEAIAEIARTNPPLPQELVDPDAEEEEAGGDDEADA